MTVYTAYMFCVCMFAFLCKCLHMICVYVCMNVSAYKNFKLAAKVFFNYSLFYWGKVFCWTWILKVLRSLHSYLALNIPCLWFLADGFKDAHGIYLALPKFWESGIHASTASTLSIESYLQPPMFHWMNCKNKVQAPWLQVLKYMPPI